MSVLDVPSRVCLCVLIPGVSFFKSFVTKFFRNFVEEINEIVSYSFSPQQQRMDERREIYWLAETYSDDTSQRQSGSRAVRRWSAGACTLF